MLHFIDFISRRSILFRRKQSFRSSPKIEAKSRQTLYKTLDDELQSLVNLYDEGPRLYEK